MQSEECYRFVRGGFSLTAPANEQAGGDSVAMRVDHDEMCQLDHILSFDWLFAAPNRPRSEFQNERRFGRMSLGSGTATKSKRGRKFPMGAGSSNKWFVPRLVAAKSAVLFMGVRLSGECRQIPGSIHIKDIAPL